MLSPNLNGYTLDNIPDNVLWKGQGDDKEIIGYCDLAFALSGIDEKILNPNLIFRYTLSKELLADGYYIPLTYGHKSSGQAVLVHCDYNLILEYIYRTVTRPLELSDESFDLLVKNYKAYIGDRVKREQAAKLDAKLAELAELTGKSVAELRKTIAK